MDLQNSTALVTGGAVRLGRAIALGLADAGANVCIHYGHSRDKADETCKQLDSRSVRSAAVQCDFGAEAPDWKSFLDRVEEAIGPVDILVNNAAIFEAETLEELTPERWGRHLDINLRAPLFVTQQFAQRLGDRSGHVLNIVDWRGLNPVPGHLSYTMAKSGLAAATRLLAQELGPRIRVNGIAPGAILPPPGGDEATFESRGRLNPLNKTGAASDIVDAALFLLRSEFTTGEILHVTGGEQLLVHSATQD